MHKELGCYKPDHQDRFLDCALENSLSENYSLAARVIDSLEEYATAKNMTNFQAVLGELLCQ